MSLSDGVNDGVIMMMMEITGHKRTCWVEISAGKKPTSQFLLHTSVDVNYIGEGLI